MISIRTADILERVKSNKPIIYTRGVMHQSLWNHKEFDGKLIEIFNFKSPGQPGIRVSVRDNSSFKVIDDKGLRIKNNTLYRYAANDDVTVITAIPYSIKRADIIEKLKRDNTPIVNVDLVIQFYDTGNSGDGWRKQTINGNDVNFADMYIYIKEMMSGPRDTIIENMINEAIKPSNIHATIYGKPNESFYDFSLRILKEMKEKLRLISKTEPTSVTNTQNPQHKIHLSIQPIQ